MIQRAAYTAVFISLIFRLNAQNVEEQVKKLSSAVYMKNGILSVAVADIQSKKMVYTYQAEKWQTPASVLKILTTGAAFGILGKEFTFSTELQYDGNIDNGTLNGNLYLKGGGDPTFFSHRTSASWQPFLDALRKAGINSINGQILPLEEGFTPDDTPKKWLWMDMGNYFAAEARAINYKENFFKLYFKTGAKAGDSTQLLYSEPEGYVQQYKNYVTTGVAGSGDEAYIYGLPNSPYKYIKGTLPPDSPKFSIKAAMSDPGMQACTDLKEFLQKNEVKVNNNQLPKTTPQQLYVHKSAILSEIIKLTNCHSINLYAEAILKQIALKKNKPANTEEGIKCVLDYWKGLGLNISEILMEDGSGLSPMSMLKATDLTAVLLKISSQSYSADFEATLPVSGESGTLKNMGKGSALEGKFKAKSGNIDKVYNYAGYLTTVTGKRLAISIFTTKYSCTDYAMKKELEQLILSIYLNY